MKNLLTYITLFMMVCAVAVASTPPTIPISELPPGGLGADALADLSASPVGGWSLANGYAAPGTEPFASTTYSIDGKHPTTLSMSLEGPVIATALNSLPW